LTKTNSEADVKQKKPSLGRSVRQKLGPKEPSEGAGEEEWARYHNQRTAFALSHHIQQKRQEALKRKSKTTLSKIVAAHAKVHESKEMLSKLTVELAECASAMGCTGDEISQLENEKIVPAIFDCSPAQQEEYKICSEEVKPPCMWTASLSQTEAFKEILGKVDLQLEQDQQAATGATNTIV
jgi:hypothetical protein